MSDYETIEFSVDQNLAIITLNRPAQLNAINGKMKNELLNALRKVERAKSEVRALLITGTGRAFCSGADLAGGGPGEIDAGADLIDTYHPVLTELSSLQIPIISAVNGVAAGAGMSIAISADIVLAAKSAYFLQAFVNIGLTPDAGSTFHLPRLIGDARARAMMMLGEKIPADTAKDWGMIYDVCDDEALKETAGTIALKLANGPTLAHAGIKKLLSVSDKNGYSDQLHAEALVQRMASRSSDCVEGVTAFLQKREADFKGY